MTTPPRIPPLAPPYEPEVDAELKAMMPEGAAIEPLKLFRTLGHNLPMSAAMRALGSYVLGRGGHALGSRDREIVIDRVCARCGCEYEWGVHAIAFGPRVGLTEAQIAATASGGADDPAWSARDRLLIRLVDELHDTATVSDALWVELAQHWTRPRLLELLLIAGWYHAISYLANGARVEREEWALRFPSAAPAAD